MTPFRDYRIETREKNWGSTQTESLCREQIQTWCLLRIADAAEKLCQSRYDLEHQLSYYKKDAAQLTKKLELERRRTAAYKGVITRLRQELKES